MSVATSGHHRCLPYRDQEFELHCTTCEKAPALPCNCCDRPMCARHIEKDGRCRKCDEHLYRLQHASRADGDNWAWGILMLWLAATLYAAFKLPSAAPILAVGLIVIYPLATMVIRTRNRRKTLANLRNHMRALNAGQSATPNLSATEQAEALALQRLNDPVPDVQLVAPVTTSTDDKPTG